jgi:hypothetical protein
MLEGGCNELVSSLYSTSDISWIITAALAFTDEVKVRQR